MKVLARSLGEGAHDGEPETSLAGEAISVAIRWPFCISSDHTRFVTAPQGALSTVALVTSTALRIDKVT